MRGIGQRKKPWMDELAGLLRIIPLVPVPRSFHATLFGKHLHSLVRRRVTGLLLHNFEVWITGDSRSAICSMPERGVVLAPAPPVSRGTSPHCHFTWACRNSGRWEGSVQSMEGLGLPFPLHSPGEVAPGTVEEGIRVLGNPFCPWC